VLRNFFSTGAGGQTHGRVGVRPRPIGAGSEDITGAKAWRRHDNGQRTVITRGANQRINNWKRYCAIVHSRLTATSIPRPMGTGASEFALWLRCQSITIGETSPMTTRQHEEKKIILE